MKTVGITGSEGLIGAALVSALRSNGVVVRCLDLSLPMADPGRGSVLDPDAVVHFVSGCDGVVHLAAVSRVVLGESDPRLCWDTNVGGTQIVLEAALQAPRHPWVLLASSREVYGQAEALPVRDDAPVRPINIYGRSKAEAEQRALAARGRGLRIAVLRFSNVYGSICDHADRVVPAFARAAASGELLRIEGGDHLFDFTHLSDTVAGILSAIRRLELGGELPPLHLVTGRGTTLGELAALAVRAGGGRSRCIAAPARGYDVARFVGDPARTRDLLGFRARISIADGVARLVHAFAGTLSPAAQAGGAR